MSDKHTKLALRRNRLVAHCDGSFSVRIGGHWGRRIPALTQNQYLALLREDRERLVLREFQTGRSVTGSRVLVARPNERVAA
jgi:hypothetical protein